MIWPVGQPLGELHAMAMRSRELWLAALRGSGVWHSACGSMHLAHHEDELEVMREFVEASRGTARACELWSADKAAEHCPQARRAIVLAWPNG